MQIPDAGPTSAGVERLTLAMRDLWWLRRARLRDADGPCTLTGARILHILHVTGAARVSDLAAGAGVDISVASRQVSVLEAQGLVEKATDPADGRSHLVQITAAGTETHEGIQTGQLRAVTEALSTWSPDEMLAVAASLERLRAHLVESGLFHGPATSTTLATDTTKVTA
jgi:DNA-binding MarR family transcriptional regulator